MKNQVIAAFEQKYSAGQKNHPKFRPGDTVRVHYKIQEGQAKPGEEKKFRIQQFEGVCVRFKKGGSNSSFAVRKISANSVGVERVFPLNSPYVDRVDLLAGGRVRRSRLFYLRERSGKSARIKTRRFKAGERLSSVDLPAAE